MKKNVVYFGVIFIEEKNALCQRAMAICKSAKSLGYTPILVGMSKSVSQKEFRKGRLSNGQIYYEIEYPNNTGEWIRSLFTAHDAIRVFDDIDPRSIKNIVVADYRFLPMCAIKRYCKRNNVDFTIDVQDWFMPRPIWSVKTWIKMLDNFCRLRILYPSVERKICISRGFATMYKKTSKLALLPGTTDPTEDKWNSEQYKKNKEKIVLSFAGRPGKHCEKEKIDWVMRAIYELRDIKRIEFHVAGITKDEFLADNPGLKKYAEQDEIVFYGNLTHEECVNLIIKSDFTVLIRPNNKLSNYGFSTKISESFACGTPIIATTTSDIREYIVDMRNGLVTECNYQSVKNALKKICALKSADIEEMHIYTKLNNPLAFSCFDEELRKVL